MQLCVAKRKPLIISSHFILIPLFSTFQVSNCSMLQTVTVVMHVKLYVTQVDLCSTNTAKSFVEIISMWQPGIQADAHKLLIGILQ